MCPDPIRRKGRKTLAKVYDSLSGPEKAPDRSRIIGLPTKKEARDIRNELTAAAWVGGRSVSRIRTAKEYISVVESFFRKLRAIKNAEPRTPQTGIPSLRELLRDTRVTSLDEYERMLEITSADTVILLVGRKDRRGRGARMLLALNEMRLKMGKATILLAHGAEKRPQSRPARVQAQVLPAIGKGVRRRSGGSPSPRSRTRPAGRRSLFRLTLESFLSPSRTHGPDSARFSPIQLVPHSFSAAP